MGVFEARERQAEVIESAIKDLAGDGDAEIGHLGDVRQAHPARRMLLPKDDLPIRAVHRPPSPDAALEGSPRSGAQVWMAAAEILEDGDRSQYGRCLRLRRGFIVPDIGEGIGSAAVFSPPLFSWEAGVRRLGERRV